VPVPGLNTKRTFAKLTIIFFVVLGKKLKSCESNTQELSSSIKRPSLLIMGIKEGE
jgi:hypothetical protein